MFGATKAETQEAHTMVSVEEEKEIFCVRVDSPV